MEECDYMSDIFVEQANKHDSTLSMSRKRKIKDDQSKKTVKTKSRIVIEKETREKGLSTAISNDNLGFKLMSKMGYVDGKGLGKSNQGRIEPVAIELKSNREGLGKRAHDEKRLKIRQNLNEILHKRKFKLESLQRTDFRSRMSSKYSSQQIQSDLYKSQKVCHNLDTKNENEDPVYDFFWPEYTIKTEEDEEDLDFEEDEEYSLEDKLMMLTDYLRKTYFYCIWCAEQYKNVEDLQNNCPGDNSKCHDDL